MKSVSETILYNLNTLLVVVDRQGEVSYVSPSVQRVLGFDSSELLGNGWWDLPRNSSQESFEVKSEILSLMRSNCALPSYEREMISSRGEKKYVMWNVCRSDDGGLVGIGYDVTERKHAELLLDEKVKELQLKNAELTGSITYAKRIQQSILADPDGLSQHISDSFVLYQPKDIVSGDLYWYHRKNEKLYVAAVDCTGHGVPGALMSVVANGLLRNTIIKKTFSDPAEILHALDEELQSAFPGENVSDGMDIALCEIDLAKNELLFAGAYRPCALIRKGELRELKGSKYPIGAFECAEKKFELHREALLPGDTLYLFSDGYTDQFGGERCKKFQRRNFYELLQSVQDMDMCEQKAFLEYAHNNWKQDAEQTDDILVMGLKI